MQIRGYPRQLTMGHLPLAPVTLNSQWRIGILNWTQGPTMSQTVNGRGQTIGKAMLSRTKPPAGAKLHSNGTTTNACTNHPLVNSRSPSELWLVIISFLAHGKHYANLQAVLKICQLFISKLSTISKTSQLLIPDFGIMRCPTASSK